MEKMFTEGAIRVMMCTATVLIQRYFLINLIFIFKARLGS